MSLRVTPACLNEDPLPEDDTAHVVVPACSLAAPILTMDWENSENGSTILQWVQGYGRDGSEVWRSQNGGDFELIATLGTGVVTYTDSDVMATNDVWCYKVLGVTGAIKSDFSNEGCTVNEYTGTEGGSVEHPTWMLAYGDFTPADPDNAATVDLSGLLAVINGGFFFSSTQLLTAINLDSLIKTDQSFVISDSEMLIQVRLPSFVICGGDFHIDSGAAIGALIAPVFSDLSDDMFCSDCPLLDDVQLDAYVVDAGIMDFNGDALGPAVIEHILDRAIASSVTTASIFMDGGESTGLAALPAAVQQKYQDLIDAGNSILLNP
jgi:hypothetical protein